MKGVLYARVSFASGLLVILVITKSWTFCFSNITMAMHLSKANFSNWQKLINSP